jgi:hypothetical protein
VKKAILQGTLIVGVLDISEVMLFYFFRGVHPDRILKGIASVPLGREVAMNGGPGIALFGLALHFFVAFSVVTIYLLASRKVNVLTSHPWIAGPLYGIAVHFAMTRLFIPLVTGHGPRPQEWWMIANAIFAHIACVGLPIALIARRYRLSQVAS